ncbi:MAG: pyridoxine 5'-phosphate synthase [Mariprofundaceae bacterium]|nr:pyridoxine 5'-phosphate synthase [Mariprofundaceae bacterium]
MLLGVNIDHIATLRQARLTPYPDPIAAAKLCMAAGAHGITAHLREDRRHIQDLDMEQLASMDLYLNMEMAAQPAMVAIACRLKPQAVCLVPEKRQELTTEGGLNVAAQQDRLRDVVRTLQDAGCRVSLFIDPSIQQIDASVAVGASVIELHTGHYANINGDARQQECAAIATAAAYATSAGLEVHAGHGLTLENTPAIAAIKEITTLNIGHAIVADAVFKGLQQAVADFKTCMQR